MLFLKGMDRENGADLSAIVEAHVAIPTRTDVQQHAPFKFTRQIRHLLRLRDA